MNREETIYVLNELLEKVKASQNKTNILVKEKQALEFAIEALNRPHENWEHLKEHITEMRDADGELNQKDTCRFILNLMGVIERECEDKTPTVEKAHGEWIVGYDSYGSVYHYCSKCKYEKPSTHYDWNFCPICGSDNRGEGESE